MTDDDPVAIGQAALQTGRWADARAAFGAALAHEVTPEALLGMAQSLWWQGETRQSIAHQERAYVLLRRRGDNVDAAQVAMFVGLAYYSDLGHQAVAAGWLSRAERLLTGTDPGLEHGWLWLVRAGTTSDLEVAREHAGRALEMARLVDDTDLELASLGELGLILVGLGKHDEGLRLVDEAVAAALGGESSSLDIVVMTCCEMLEACELAGDLARAAQWCKVVDDFAGTYGCPYLYATCRTLYGAVLVAAGQWTEAEHELQAAVRMTEGAAPARRAEAVSRLADLRLRQGRLEDAVRLLGETSDETVSAVTRARVRLALGEPTVAIPLLRHWLDAHPGRHPRAASALEGLVDAHLSQGNVAAADAVAAELTDLSDALPHDEIVARAAMARAKVAVARDDRAAAAEHLERALVLLSRLDLPLDASRARLALAHAHAGAAPELAIAEARQALACFERLGASVDADIAAQLLRSLGVVGRTGPKGDGALTKREQEVLRLVGEGLSNPEIAQRLFISRRTAAHHVSNVLAKLGLRNRAEAVAHVSRNTNEMASR